MQVEEIYTLNEPELLEKLKPIYGLVFLFKWTQKIEARQTLDFYDEDLFFAN